MGRGIERVDLDGPFFERHDVAHSAQRPEQTAENEQGVEIIGVLVQDALETPDPLDRLIPGDEHGPDKAGIGTFGIQSKGLLHVVFGLLPAVSLLLETEIEKLEMNGYILHRLVQKVGDDLDLVLIGNKGLWLFEVKYWSGTIIHEQGQWHQEKRYFLRGGVGQTNLRPVSQPPETQWKRMRDDLVYTLTRHAPNLVKDHLAIKDIQGGVVFTHPSAEIEIPKGAGFNWGNIPFWIQFLQDAPVKEEFCDERLCLMITEIILNRHNIIEKDSILQSMSDYVEQIVAQEEIKIKNWTQNRSKNPL